MIVKMITAKVDRNNHIDKIIVCIQINLGQVVLLVCVFRLKDSTVARYTGVCMCVSYCTAVCQSSVSRASDPESAQPPAPPGVCCTSPSETQFYRHITLSRDSSSVY